MAALTAAGTLPTPQLDGGADPGEPFATGDAATSAAAIARHEGT